MEVKLKKAQSTNTVAQNIRLKQEQISDISFDTFDTRVVIRCLLELDEAGNLMHQKELMVEIQRCILSNDTKLAQFFISSSEAILHFSEKHILLVQQLMNSFPWTTKHESIVRAFSDWVCNLVSAQNGFVEYVHRFLVMALRPLAPQTKVHRLFSICSVFSRNYSKFKVN